MPKILWLWARIGSRVKISHYIQPIVISLVPYRKVSTFNQIDFTFRTGRHTGTKTAKFYWFWSNEYLPNLMENQTFPQIFIYWVIDFKLCLHWWKFFGQIWPKNFYQCTFFVNCANLESDWTNLMIFDNPPPKKKERPPL